MSGWLGKPLQSVEPVFLVECVSSSKMLIFKAMWLYRRKRTKKRIKTVVHPLLARLGPLAV